VRAAITTGFLFGGCMPWETKSEVTIKTVNDFNETGGIDVTIRTADDLKTALIEALFSHCGTCRTTESLLAELVFEWWSKAESYGRFEFCSPEEAAAWKRFVQAALDFHGTTLVEVER
jgi:thiol-disulfide isomerase/thioredoxin